MSNGNSRGDSGAEKPEREDGVILDPTKIERPKDALIANTLPENDQSLTPVEIIGRCSKCNTVGRPEWKHNLIPTKDVDNILAYKSIDCFCPTCRKTTQFLPIEVKKYRDVPFLKSVQAGVKKGTIR